MKSTKTLKLSRILIGTVLFSGVLVTQAAFADKTLYFVRHAEKQTVLLEQGTGTDKKYREDCTYDKQETDCCVEELNKLGELRADELASWFLKEEITDDLTAIFSSHKQRTLQTVQPIADLTGNDLQVEQMGMDCAINPNRPYYECADGCTSGSASIDDTLYAIYDPLSGSTILIGAHSGTIYKIMDLLDGEYDDYMGDIDLLDNETFPRKEPGESDSKVKGYNNLWKVTIQSSGRFKVKHEVLDLTLEKIN